MPVLHNTHRTFRGARKNGSAVGEARRLRLGYSRLRRQLAVLHGSNDADTKTEELWIRVDHITRELGSIKADSLHVIEAKLKVAVLLANDHIDRTLQRLLASALSDLRYLAFLREA